MARHPIRFGLQTGQQNVEWETLVSLWRDADSWGYDSLWNFDHFYPLFSDPAGPCLEGWTTLAALSQVAKRATVGALVNGNTYRHPSLTAKMTATMDHVSGGRFVLGIGAGWFELEHATLGFDFKDVRGRLEALDEALEIIRGLLTQEKTTVEGKHYRVKDALGSPKPLQTPYPPIMIGGSGEKVLLRIVAKHADVWNSFGDPARMKHLIEVIDRHGETVGRDTSRIEKTVAMLFGYGASAEREQRVLETAVGMVGGTIEEARARVMVGSKDECLERIAGFEKVGVTHFIFMIMPPYDREALRAFVEEVVPAAKRLRG
jgi:F420-dependent oxidoreductase-like protein